MISADRISQSFHATTFLETHMPAGLQGKRMNDVANRMHVAMPKLRDGAVRPANIPASVLVARAKESGTASSQRKLERDLQVTQCHKKCPAGCLCADSCNFVGVLG